jgi:hypothetical protein
MAPRSRSTHYAVVRSISNKSRVQLVASHLSVADAYVGEGLVQIIDQYQEAIVQAD